MNLTTVDSQTIYTVEDEYIVASLSVGFSCIATITSAIMLVLIWRTKRRLHTVTHLLIGNTCIASIFYCIVTINNYIFLIFVRSEISDMSCRWRGYFTYAGISGLSYSYLIQSVSRFFICILSSKYRWLTKFKTHYILIGIQWVAVFLITSPSIITKDIPFHPKFLCWVPIEYTLHTIYTYLMYYIIPLVIIIIIYIYIYYRVRKSKKNVRTIIISINSPKYDLELLRNIIILISIYLGGGLPSLLSDLTLSKVPYLLSLIIQSLSVFLANLCTIVLNREIRQVIKSIICRTTAVTPFNNVYPVGKLQENHQITKKTNVKHVQTVGRQ
jgi:hypothetical protein